MLGVLLGVGLAGLGVCIRAQIACFTVRICRQCYKCLNFKHILAVNVQQDAPRYAGGRVYYSVQGVGMGHPGGLRMYICPMTAGGIFQSVNHL